MVSHYRYNHRQTITQISKVQDLQILNNMLQIYLCRIQTHIICPELDILITICRTVFSKIKIKIFHQQKEIKKDVSQIFNLLLHLTITQLYLKEMELICNQ